MSNFTLYDGEFGEYKVSFLPNFQEERLIDFQMNLAKKPGNLDESQEYQLCYSYKEVVLLRDYLTSVINLYEKTPNKDSESKEKNNE